MPSDHEGEGSIKKELIETEARKQSVMNGAIGAAVGQTHADAKMAEVSAMQPNADHYNVQNVMHPTGWAPLTTADVQRASARASMHAMEYQSTHNQYAAMREAARTSAITPELQNLQKSLAQEQKNDTASYTFQSDMRLRTELQTQVFWLR